MAVHAYGTTFTWDGVVVAGLTAVNGIELTADTVDVTTLSSANAYKEFLTGFIEAGDISLDGYFDYTDTTGQQAMITDLNDRASKTFTITFPTSTGATWTGSAYLTGVKIGDAGIDGAIPFTASMKPTGKPTFSVAVSNNLSNLVLTTATLYPAFAAGTYTYSATTTGASFTVTPSFAAGVCTVVSGAVNSTVGTGAASAAISAGVSGTLTVVTITVAETNKAPKVYTVSVAKTA